MSLFSAIMDKIFHHPSASPTAAPASSAPSQAAAAPMSAPAAPSASAPAAAGTQAVAPVDVDTVLTEMALAKNGGGNWRSSIVDLLKLLDLDSGLAARKQLADELDVHVAADGSAEENLALHRAVMKKLAENGGKVPDSLRG